MVTVMTKGLKLYNKDGKDALVHDKVVNKTVVTKTIFFSHNFSPFQSLALPVDAEHSINSYLYCFIQHCRIKFLFSSEIIEFIKLLIILCCVCPSLCEQSDNITNFSEYPSTEATSEM